ncbi:hypothetical protein BH10CYA1_BH10CYA1_54550 [soil metagenome]
MPHGFCLHWNGPLLFVFIAGNLGIALAYFLIPTALQRFIGKRKDLPYPYMFKLFAAFILSCGITHLAKIWTLYHADYWLEAALDLWTAGVSLTTAALLYPIIPQALQLRSPKELEAANEKLEKQIQETSKAKAEAESARDEAIRANKLKSEFVATVSHEIRTPLSGVVGLAEILTRDPDPEELPEVSQLLYGASKNLLSVLNSLLDFSKLEAGRMGIEVVSFSPQEIITVVAELVSPNIKAKGLTLEPLVDLRLPETLYGDETKLRQILINFVHNAIKFTQPGGQIRIAAEVKEDNEQTVTVRFSVTDTGIGINPEVLSSLFQPFVQADASTTRQYGGTGLGLSISKRYVDLLQGQIGVESKPTEGSTFWIIVPFAKTKS